jgi:hypothetical protein
MRCKWDMVRESAQDLRRLIRRDSIPILVILGISLVVGVAIVTNYGESWDEQLRYQYASKSLLAYYGDMRTLKDEKGPFYVMVAKIGSEALHAIYSGWQPIDAWHFMHFLSFLLGAFFLYLICLEVTHKWGAVAGTLLFVSQPLLWGHAFINPKDIPFMSFFLGSVALGIRMNDFLAENPPARANFQTSIDDHRFVGLISRDWQALSVRLRSFSILLSIILILALLFLILAQSLMINGLVSLVEQAYNADAATPLGSVFSRLAQNMNTVPLASYQEKVVNLYPKLVSLFGVGILFVLFILAWRSLPLTVRWSWQRWIQPNIKQIGRYAIQKPVLSAGIFLGLCSSIRTVGPFSGLLVAGYLLFRLKGKAIPGLIAYFFVAILITYASWPALWGAPIENYLRSLSQASDFSWDGKVMFQGVDYGVGQLPRSYMPTLLALQFSEPTLALFLVGVAAAMKNWVRRDHVNSLLAVVAAWLLVPIAGVVILQPTMYDNFRQFLFIVPPIFVFAALGFGFLADYLRKSVLRGFLLAVLVLPNIYSDINLHPYQYVYYNSLTGGIRGAFRKYEMDYWATSYREAANYLNKFAPENTSVVVWGPDHVIQRYARPDLDIREYRKEQDNLIPGDFVILSTRHNKDETLYTDAQPVFQVSRSGGMFVVVKRISK